MFPHEPMPEHIGPYKILRHLSSRGSADLYLGEHVGPMGFQRTCVLKLVPAPSSDDLRSAQELAHEAKICARLNHPAIVRMHDFFEYGDRLVLVFEHFAGLSLARLLAHLRRRRFEMSDPVAWYISHQLFSALAHAHALTDDEGRPTPVVHRDVQPAHIVIASDGQVRLTGYGIAKIAGTVGDTAVGFIKGTPAYMAPEQARGEKVTERVDVYAAGLVVWEMLTGQSAVPPGTAKPGGELLRLISGRRVDPISAMRTNIPREIGAAIDACLEPVAEKRTIKCADVERWLKKVCDVNAGRDQLKERLVQMRNVSTRPAAPTSQRVPPVAKPSKSPDSVRVPPRFPGVATRVTGRVSTAAPGQSQAPPQSRRAPALRGTRSQAPPFGSEPPSSDGAEMLDASDVQEDKPQPKRRTGTLLGMAPPPPDLAKSLRAPGVPEGEEQPKSVAPRPASRAPSAQQRGRTLLGVAPSKAPGTASAAPAAPAAVALSEEQKVVTTSEVQPSEASAVVVAQEPDSSASVLSMADLEEVSSESLNVFEPRVLDPAENTKLSKRRRIARWLIGVPVGVVVSAVLAVGAVSLLRAKPAVLSPTPSVSVASTRTALSTSAAAASVPATVASAEPSAAPSSSVSTSPAPASSQWWASYDLSTIPPGMGLLLAKSPPEGVVYVNGIQTGDTDKPVTAPCGRRFVRIGTRLGPLGLKAVSWLSEGQSVIIPCGKPIDIDATPAVPIRSNPKKPPNQNRLPWSIAPF